MPSSTFNSSHRAPDGPWVRTWLFAFVIACLFAGSLESYWRSQGFRPSIHDDMDFWAYHRSRVYRDRSVVLLGTSRMQAGFSTQTFRRRFPDHNLVQLAISGGGPPLATLVDLANDKDFRGTILCEIPNWWLRPGAWDEQRAYVLNARRMSSNTDACANRVVHAFMRSKLVTLRPETNLRNYLTAFARDWDLPKPENKLVRFDRERLLDFSDVDVAALRQERIARWKAEGHQSRMGVDRSYNEDFSRVQKLVESIEDRGGQVLFIRLPIGRERIPFDERMWPRALTWDAFAETTSSVMIHFQDVPSLNRFECPDDSHLDMRDMAKFTNALLDELVRRGVFKN